MSVADKTAAQIEKLRRRLGALDREREEIAAELEQLKRPHLTDHDNTERAKPAPPAITAAVTMASGTADRLSEPGLYGGCR